MIFVTVGAQMPFDRLIHTVDEWAGRTGEKDIFAQIGRTGMQPSHMRYTPFLDPTEFRQRLFDAHIVITHAGMGTILSALELGRPVVVMPRRGELHETRNDHQVGTARTFARTHHVAVSWDEQALARQLDHLDEVPIPDRVSSHASTELLDHLRQFIHGEPMQLPRFHPAPEPAEIPKKKPAQPGREAA